MNVKRKQAKTMKEVAFQVMRKRNTKKHAFEFCIKCDSI